jgi:hypothetical protein
MLKLPIKKIIGYLIIAITQILPIIVLCNDLGFFIGIGLYILMLILLFLFIWFLNYLFK